MDFEFHRPPRHRATAAQPSARLYTAAHQNMISAMSPVASVLQQVTAPTVASKQPVKHTDFITGAKVYQKSRRLESLGRIIAISVYILIGFAIITAAAGFLVNKKYTGKALPFTYIGDVSVGGLTQGEIKSALDEKAKNLQITFIDGGLSRTVPINKFEVTIDTEQASKRAIQEGFNPFAFLSKRRYEPAVTINERYLAGYATSVLNIGKTSSENAKIVAEKNKLVIQREVQGFKTNPQLLAARIKTGLSTMSNPNIKLSNLNYKPAVYATDLEDDLTRANAMVGATVSIEYGKSVAKPSLEQKISWLQIAEAPGSNNLSFGFSKTLVRQYVLDLANKYQGETIDANKIKNPSAVGSITQKGLVINNIDEATDSIIASLSGAKSVTQKLTTTDGTFNKLIYTN